MASAYRKKNMNKQTVAALICASFIAIVLCLTLLSHKTSPTSVTSAKLPAITGSGYSWVNDKDGFGSKRGIVITNVFLAYKTNDLVGRQSAFLFTPEDQLVYEMLIHGAETIKKNPGTPNIPYFFMRREKIRVEEICSDLTLLHREDIRAQNVKLIPKPSSEKEESQP
jgi:hypothetical protein